MSQIAANAMNQDRAQYQQPHDLRELPLQITSTATGKRRQITQNGLVGSQGSQGPGRGFGFRGWGSGTFGHGGRQPDRRLLVKARARTNDAHLDIGAFEHTIAKSKLYTRAPYPQ